MEDERRDSVAEDVVVEEEADGNGETDGGLESRSRKKRLLEKEVEIEGAAVVDCQVAVEHKRSVYLDQEQGIKSSDEINSTESQKADQLVADKSMQNNETDCLSEHDKDFPVIENHHHRNDLKVENQPTSEEECGRKLTGKEFVSKSEQAKPLSENKSVVEIDLERILEEQDTHDLYCPNCHSCITKRVILRKRKRTARENISDAKREKIEPVQADLTANTPAAENTGQSDDTEPDVFRCLSCLSFFIPTDTGFRLFKIFGKREENENVQSSQQMPGRHQNWMFSFFELMKRKNKGSGLEDPLLADSHDGYGGKADNIQREKQHITSDASLSEAILPGKCQSDIKEEQINVDKYSDAGDVQHRGKDMNTVSFPSPWQSQKYPPVEIQNASMLYEQLPKSISSSIGRRVEHVEKDSVKYAPIPQNRQSILFEKIEIEKAEKLHGSREGSEGDMIISVPEGKMEPIQETYLEGPPRNDSSLSTATAPGLPILGETRIHLGEQTIAETRQTQQWDVLKAIVYGGLLESIASLSIIASAAGSNVSTLNVVALGLANLVGGLFAMIHNLLGFVIIWGMLAGMFLYSHHWHYPFQLVELKSEQYKSISSNKKEETDRYWELLGRRGYFRLHATVALISYIFIGILPPIIYGFSFTKSHHKEYKLMVVACASLLCITLLAIGKAHVQEGRKPYAKTLLHYIVLGFGASGLSYAVGMLIKKLLQELGLFDDYVALPTPLVSSILEVTSRTPPWRPH